MKNYLVLALIASFIFCNSNAQSLQNYSDSENETLFEHDETLIGVWLGYEIEQEREGLKKEWEFTRFKDGKFIFKYISTYYDELDTLIEYGKWHTKNGFYFDVRPNGQVDKYKYEIINADNLKFISTKKPNMDGKIYYFTETRAML